MLVVLAAACSGGSGSDGHRASSKATPPPSSAPPPSIDLSKPIPGGSLHGTPRPPLENTGTNYVAIFKSLIANQRWISENPDPALVSDVYVPGTPGHDARVSAYQFLVDHRYRWADEGFYLLSIDVINATTDAVSLRVTDSLEFERLVDEAGNQVGSIRPRDPVTQDRTTLLSRDAKGLWRIADVSAGGSEAVQL